MVDISNNTDQRFEQGMKTAVLTIVVNLCLAVIKIFAGIIGHSYALIADGLESVTDIFSSTAVWGGFKIGAIPPDYNHPFGHGRAESLSAFLVSLSLIAAGCIIVLQSIREILTPHLGPHPYTLIVLLFVIAVKEGLYRFLFKKGQGLASSAMVFDAWHSRSDALTSLAAFVGITVATIGGPKFYNADEWAALFASGIIFFNGFKLLKIAIGEIMDEAVDSTVEDKIRSIAQQIGRVSAIEKCRIRKCGHGYFLEVHVQVNGHMSVIEGHDIAHKVKDALVRSDIKVLDATIHIEPYYGTYSNQ